MKISAKFFALILILNCRLSIAQPDTLEYFADLPLRYENYVYADNIKSVLLEKAGFRLSEPALFFGSNEKLILSFDDLQGGVSDYSYTFIHCNSDWTPTQIPVSQYLQGFSDDRIFDYAFSFNTIQSYTHYFLEFPNENLEPLLSGNYIIRIFETGNPEKTIITRRWLYYENKVQIDATVKRATVIADRYSKQEIDFSVNYFSLPVQNPFSEFKVVLQQNSRWDNVIHNLKPLYIKDRLLDYNYEEENTFNGGNEFRTFDTRSYKTPNQYVRGFLEDSSGIDAYIKDDISRAAYRYSIEDDINGKYLVSMYAGRDESREADYITVHFKLLMEYPVENGTPYIFGALTDWQLLPEAKLKYDYEKQAYHTELFLKQGYYNYEYVVLTDSNLSADETQIEGNHFETENDYSIMVYYIPPGSRYEQLAAWKRISSKNIY